MSYTLAVLYPNNEGATFDMNYYQTTHMPLVSKLWEKYGLKSWKVLEFEAGPDGAKPEYSGGALVIWGSKEDFGKAVSSEDAKAIFDDIPKFTNTDPVKLAGPIVSSWATVSAGSN